MPQPLRIEFEGAFCHTMNRGDRRKGDDRDWGAIRQGCFFAAEEPKEELARPGWQETDLDRRRKGDPGKVRIARRLRAETTMTLAWIAHRLRMGTWTHVSNLLATGPKAGRGTARK